MVELEEFENIISADVVGCPAPLITFHLKRAIIDFCKESWAFVKEINHTIASGDIDEDLHDSLDIDVGAYVDDLLPHIIVELWIDGIQYEPELADVPEVVPDLSTIHSSSKKYYQRVDSTILRIFHMSSTDKNVYLKIAFKPPMSMEEVEDFLYEDWVDAIVAGALERILSMPRKEWTDLVTARQKRSDFRRGISEARNRVSRSYSAKPVQVNWQSFGDID